VPSSTSKPPESPVFFIDRNLSKNIFARAFAAAGVRCELHDNHFPPNTPDTVWIEEVAKRGWVILTADRRIRYNTWEKKVFLAAKTYIFVLGTRQSLKATEMAELFLRAVDAMTRALAEHEAPVIFKVYQDGRVEPWLTE
jgi:PIN like domain